MPNLERWEPWIEDVMPNYDRPLMMTADGRGNTGPYLLLKTRLRCCASWMCCSWSSPTGTCVALRRTNSGRFRKRLAMRRKRSSALEIRRLSYWFKTRLDCNYNRMGQEPKSRCLLVPDWSPVNQHPIRNSIGQGENESQLQPGGRISSPNPNRWLGFGAKSIVIFF